MAQTWFSKMLDRMEANASRFSNAQYILPVEIQSTHTMRLLKQLYISTANSLYISSTVLRFILHNDEKKIAPVSSIIDKYLKDASTEMSDALEQMKLILQSQNVDLKIAYTMPAIYEAPVTCPRCKQYLGLYLMLDNLIKYFDTLWLAEGIAEKDYTEQVYKWRKFIADLSGRIITFVGSAVTKAVATNMPDLAQKLSIADREVSDQAIESLIQNTQAEETLSINVAA